LILAQTGGPAHIEAFTDARFVMRNTPVARQFEFRMNYPLQS